MGAVVAAVDVAVAVVAAVVAETRHAGTAGDVASTPACLQGRGRGRGTWANDAQVASEGHC